MRISDAATGQEFIVKAVRLSREVGRRLADMGFTDGALGRIVRQGAFRGPLQVRIRDYDVLIRRCEAAGIEVDPVGESPADSGPGERSRPARGFHPHGTRGVGRRGFGRRGRHSGRFGTGGFGVDEPSARGGDL